MKEVLLLKCGEIVLKGLNRKTFEDRLLKNLKRRMAHVADCEITMRQSVVYVEIPDDADADAVMECASRVFGFATISRKRRSRVSLRPQRTIWHPILRQLRPLRSSPSAATRNSR